jgi:hypothetical protein
MVLKLKIKTIFNFLQDFHLKSWTSSHGSPLKTFQKKKGKKRKPSRYVEGFKKASFFEKILPDISSERRCLNNRNIFKRNGMGGDFF